MPLIGHEDKIELFKNFFKKESLSHAYLFFGDSEIGKRTFAVSFAHFLETGSFENNDTFVDTICIYPDPDKKIISIDTVRGLKKFLFQKPFKAERRIAIIDECDLLTEEAQSALLKIVEEPPKQSLIIFITQNYESIFPPLSSRLMKIYFRRLPQEKIKSILQSEYSVSEKKAEEIASYSFGRIGMAIKMIDKNKEKYTEEINTVEDLNKLILNLRNSDLYKNSGIIKELINRNSLLMRYNLNEKLQLKAISYIIKNNLL